MGAQITSQCFKAPLIFLLDELPYLNGPRFEEVRLYLDNDDAGSRKLFENPLDASKLSDMRSYYSGYEVLNAWLLGERS